jgi:hypothetical protein
LSVNRFSAADDIYVDFLLRFSVNYFGAVKRAPFFSIGADWKYNVDPAFGTMEWLRKESV